jgi:hypothetical protein
MRAGTTNTPAIRTKLGAFSGTKVTCSTIAYIPILAFLATTEPGGIKRRKAEMATRRSAGFTEPPRGDNPYCPSKGGKVNEEYRPTPRFPLDFPFTTMLTSLVIVRQNSVSTAQYPQGSAPQNAQNSNRERAIKIRRNLSDFSGFHFSNRERIAFFQFVPRCSAPALQYPVAYTGDFDQA